MSGAVNGKGERIRAPEAIVGYTRNGAYLTREEHMKGTLEPGKYADFVVLSEDLGRIGPDRIADVQVLMTFRREGGLRSAPSAGALSVGRPTGIGKCLAATALASMALAWPSAARAHDLNYALATVHFRADGTYELSVAFHIAAHVLNVEPGHLSLDDWARLREMSDEEIARRAENGLQVFRRLLRLRFDDRFVTPTEVVFPEAERIREGGLALDPQRAPPVIVRGDTPEGARRFSAAFPPQIGLVLLRSAGGGSTTGGQVIPGGKEAAELSIVVESGGVSVRPASGWLVAARHFVLGFEHIVPKGWDHVLFVLGLFLLGTQLAPLLWQVTSFTVAHTVTLALSLYGVFSLPASVVDPLIALSHRRRGGRERHDQRVACVAPSGRLRLRVSSRPGFREVLNAAGLPTTSVVLALASFNVGVEAGLAVVGAAWLVTAWAHSRSWYRPRIAIPSSCCIALVGLYWTFSRLM